MKKKNAIIIIDNKKICSTGIVRKTFIVLELVKLCLGISLQNAPSHPVKKKNPEIYKRIKWCLRRKFNEQSFSRS